MKKKENDLVMFPCPDLKSYPEAPKDQSESELFDCPKCKDKMWLSVKKKGYLMFSAALGKKIVLACYPCITEMAENDRALILDAKQLNI